MTTISGVLRDPVGNVLPDAQIEISSLLTTIDTLRNVVVLVKTDTAGNYSFTLPPGGYAVQVSYSQGRIQSGQFMLQADSPDGSLNEYLLYGEPVYSDPVLFRAIQKATNYVASNASLAVQALTKTNENSATVEQAVQDVTDKISTAVQASEVATSKADETRQLSVEAAKSRDESLSASEQAKAVLATGNLKKDITTGLAQTTNGQYFSVAQGSSSTSAIITYLNDNGKATEVAQVPGTRAVQNVEEKQNQTAQAFDTTYKFTGTAESEVVLLADSGLRKIMALDNVDQSLKVFGKTLTTTDDIAQLPQLAAGASETWQYNGTDTTRIVELVDSAGRILKYLDVNEQAQYTFGKKAGAESYKPPIAYSELVDIRSYGQSLSVSFGTDPGIETTVSNAYMFNGGIATYNKATSSLTALSNTTQRQYHETSLIHQLSLNTPDADRKYLAAASGVEGYSMAQLEPGTDPWAKFMSSIDQAVSLSEARGWQYGMPALTFFQGEADAYQGTGYDYYRGKMRLIQSRVNDKVKTVSRNTSDVPMIIYQMASHGRYEGLVNPSVEIPLAQFDEAVNNPLIQMCTPMYQFPYLDGVHLKNHGYRWLGLYREKALRYWMETGTPWKPLHPVDVYKVGLRTVVADFWVPTGKLQFRTDVVSQATDGMYGFELWQDGTRIPVTSVQILSGNKVKVTTSSDFTGTVHLAYAYTPENRGVSDGAGRYNSWNAGPVTGVRGNLCDSDDSTTDLLNSDGKPYPLHNYCVIFRKEAR